MTTPSAFSQYLLELTNRARLDPMGEYTRLVTNAPQNVQSAINFFKVDLSVLKQQFDALLPAAPLAWNDKLANAATAHSQAMINQDTQSHQLPGEAPLGQRVLAAGYDFRSLGENVYAYAQDPFHGHAGFFIDWGVSPTGIQIGAGHRVNIMNSRFTEIGIGYLVDSDVRTSVGPHVMTQNFGTRFDDKPQLTGVVINDLDGDKFYDIGEGVANIVISATGSAGTFTTTTWDAGGYNLALPSGSYQVTFKQGSKVWSTTASVGSDNVKLDAVLANLKSSASNGSQDSLYDVSRFYNTKTGAHFYTANDAERDGLIANSDLFVYEGNAFDSNATEVAGLAVYRFFNQQTGVHFYTASAQERLSVQANLPQFRDEGLSYFAYAEGGAGRQALHRFYNTDNGTHFYTASDQEQQAVLVTLPQYRYEGIGYYVDIA
ncbi:hypothetical protein HNR26_004763 [Rhizobium rosettiformans]|uniref:Uncharacterized protein n=2 Tax=Rhizobium rosettiformans TaxID=1368430 RepID=A0A4V4HPK5_9HYPH|nr:CAP domain-containing protein [Rhizobium rosettiformans]MBB5278661.1 hypothetical protein [Rhizobium rosettiformans]THV30326.1 hypothetical protein FAA86_23025 [Rhizobium rosettiformans W3]